MKWRSTYVPAAEEDALLPRHRALDRVQNITHTREELVRIVVDLREIMNRFSHSA